MTSQDLDALKEILDKASAEYKVMVSQEDIAEANRQRSLKPVDVYRLYEGNDTCLYIDISPSDISLVDEELEARGLLEIEDLDESKMLTEYVCPQCDYVATRPGKCPDDQSELLENKYLPEPEEKPRSALWPLWLLILAIVLLGTIPYTLKFFHLN